MRWNLLEDLEGREDLKGMTLFELIQHCQGQDCATCPLRNGISCALGNPGTWIDIMVEDEE